MSIRDNLKRLFAPRHLAFVGGRSMARALKRCADGGFQGQMWLVNPQHSSLEGVPCVASISDLPFAPDGVFIATNRELTLSCVAELAAKGAERGKYRGIDGMGAVSAEQGHCRDQGREAEIIIAGAGQIRRVEHDRDHHAANRRDKRAGEMGGQQDLAPA